MPFGLDSGLILHMDSGLILHTLQDGLAVSNTRRMYADEAQPVISEHRLSASSAPSGEQLRSGLGENWSGARKCA